MKESQFIKQSQKKWRNFEEDLNLEKNDPKKTSKLFVQITDDLSYARTFYPNRMVRKYLDGVSQILLQRITKNQRTSFSKFFFFWTTTLPIEVYRARRAFLVSTVVFVLAFLIGVLSSIYEPEFARVILGDSYVDMTLENIENGDPMAVYKEFNAFEGFTSITLNNIIVAFRTFIFGLIAAIGSIFILIYNGVMVGAFQYFFIEKGLFWESFLTIWQHGTLEISAIVIAGAAGVTMGKGLLFPRSFSRLQSFKISGQRGLTIFLGTVPLFIIAGFIEGFLTRATDTHPIIRISVIVICALFIFYYFGWYPRKLAKRLRFELEDEIESEGQLKIGFSKGKILSHNELFRLSFNTLFKHSSFFIMALIIGVVSSYFLVQYSLTQGFFLNAGDADQFFHFLNFEGINNVFIVFATAAIVFSLASSKVLMRTEDSILSHFSWQKILLGLVLVLPFLDHAFWLLVLPIYPMLSYLSINTNRIPHENAATWNSMTKSISDIYLISAGLSGVGLAFLILFALLAKMIIDPFILLLSDDVTTRTYMFEIFYYSGCYFVVYVVHQLIQTACYYIHYSNIEKNTAASLIKRITEFQEKYDITLNQ